MNRLLIALIAVGLMLSSSAALASKSSEEKKAAKQAEKDAKQAEKDSKKGEAVVSATGTLTNMGEKYFLVLTGGKTKVPLPPADKTGSDVKYEGFVGGTVKVTGTGSKEKDAKTKEDVATRFKTVTAIEKAAAPPATAEKAPADKKEKK